MIPMKVRPSSKAGKWRGRMEIKGTASKTAQAAEIVITKKDPAPAEIGTRAVG